MRKATWLYCHGIAPGAYDLPFRLRPQGYDRRTEQLMSHRQRSETPRAFAEWLIAIARGAQFGIEAQEAAA